MAHSLWLYRIVTKIYQRIHMPFNVSRTKFAGIQIFRMLDPNISLGSKKCTSECAVWVRACVYLRRRRSRCVPNSPQSCDWFDFDCMQNWEKRKQKKKEKKKEMRHKLKPERERICVCVCRMSGSVEIAMKSTRTRLCTFKRTRFRKVIRLWVVLPYNMYAAFIRVYVCDYVCVCVAENVFLAVVFFFLSFWLKFLFFVVVVVVALPPSHGKWRRRSPFANSIQRNVSTE